MPSPFVLSAFISIPCSVSGMMRFKSTSVRADLPLYPRGPRSGPGYVVPIHPHLIGPIRPTRRHIQTSPSRLIPDALAVPIRIGLGDPRLVPCFRCLLLLDMPPSATTGSPSAALTQFFTDDASLRRQFTGSALPTIHHPLQMVSCFRGYTTVRFRYGLSICSPPWRI